MAIFTSTTYPWITVNPSSSTGSSAGESVSITTAAHTGRNERVGSVKFSGATGTKAVTVTQEARPTFVSASTTAITEAVDASGATITITGVSNCAGLGIAASVNDGSEKTTGGVVTVGGEDESASWTGLGTVTIGSYTGYNAQVKTWTKNQGETEQYEYSIEFTIDRNEDDEDRTIYIYVVPASGSTSADLDASKAIEYRVTQNSGEFDVDPTSLNYVYGGESKDVTVTSTGEWIVTDNN